jgi:hypothetical protein
MVAPGKSLKVAYSAGHQTKQTKTLDKPKNPQIDMGSELGFIGETALRVSQIPSSNKLKQQSHHIKLPQSMLTNSAFTVHLPYD